jgi:hypothetical protein
LIAYHKVDELLRRLDVVILDIMPIAFRPHEPTLAVLARAVAPIFTQPTGGKAPVVSNLSLSFNQGKGIKEGTLFVSSP